MSILKTNEFTYYGTGGDHGSYRYLSLQDIINSFMATYVGKEKLCERVSNQDVVFHATRALQELSYDTLKSVKDWEVEIPSTLMLVMPVDYVNYVKLSWSGTAGIEHVLYPTSKTSNPKDVTEAVQDWGGFTTGGSNIDVTSDESSDTWEAYKSTTPSENNNDDYEDDTYWPAKGARYGIDPQHAQVNGSFFIDEDQGKFHFSSNLSGKTLVLRYISDGLVTNSNKDGLDLDNTIIPKLAEEAIYKWILYGVLLARKDTPYGLLTDIKKQKFAETRKAKIRLSNIKIEEITQTFRGVSKIIKH
tara:strand:+ start:1791 stop:2699 length:909 start_codon:yes stop_codon:yes gene_type:complete